MKFREHRGLLCDSMKTVVEIESTKAALVRLMKKLVGNYNIEIEEELISVKWYGGIDKRTGWDTYIVTLDRYGVVGFTDGPIKNPGHVRPGEGD